MTLRSARPHQRDGINHIMFKGSTALFWEMRLGKTMVAIRGLLEIIPKDSNVLVVAPIEAIWAWKRELEFEGCSYKVLLGTAEQRKLAFHEPVRPFGVITWYLINYEGLRTMQAHINWKRWNAIVVDESRRMANPKNVSTKILQSLERRKDQVRLVLSGKPAPESPLEYFEQFKFVKGSFAGTTNYYHFRNSFFRELAPHEWVPYPNRLEKLKDEIHKNSYFLSRKEAGINDTKIKEVRTVTLPINAERIYKEIKRDFVSKIGNTQIQTKWIPVQYMWLHQLSGGFLGEKIVWDGKIKLLERLLDSELRGEPVVVWFKFNAPIYEIAKRLKKHSMRVAKITGEETIRERFVHINEFRSGKIQVLLVQIKCGKTAIDLSTCSTAIYFSNSHSLEERLQSEDRLVNPAKNEPNLYIDLLTERTVEEDILSVLQQKKGDSRFFETSTLRKLQEAVLK